jgi:hypothetical protein
MTRSVQIGRWQQLVAEPWNLGIADRAYARLVERKKRSDALKGQPN